VPEFSVTQKSREMIPIFTARIPALETARLLLRPLQLDDAEQVQILFPHWEIVRYLASRMPWPYPPDGA
jgi:ribosomal-protein-alanine N-acetyltransferase